MEIGKREILTMTIASQIDREKMIRDYWAQATEGLRDETRVIQENFRFYCGGDGQWDKDVIAELDEAGRPHLTINKCKPAIDLMSGYQRKYRDALDLYPRRNGTRQAARILTSMGRHAMDISRPSGDYVLSEQFMMGAIGGKWWSEINIDYSQDVIGGDIQPQSASVFDVLEDPLFRGYDINCNDPFHYCRFLFRLRFLTEEQIRLLYPDKDEQMQWLSAGGLTSQYPHHMIGGGESHVDSDYDAKADNLWIPQTANLQNLQRYLVRICWLKTFRANAWLYNRQTGQLHDLKDKLEQARAITDQNPALETIVRVVPVLHRADYIGETEFFYEEDPLGGIMEYPLFRFSPYWVDGKPLGEIDNLKDCQKELNKRRSQLLHHLNSSANSGWLLEEDSVTVDQITNFETNGSRAGFVGVYKKGRQKPERIQPAQLSQGHLAAAELASKDFEDVTKLNNAVYGQMSSSGSESGEALKTRREQGLVAKETAFDNFKYTELGFFTHLVERIRRPDKYGRYVYRTEEIIQLVEENDLQIDLQTLRAMETGRYGLKVARNETQTTVRQQNFDEMMQILKLVGPLAAEIDLLDILEASDMVNKDALIEKIKARRQQRQQQELMAMAPPLPPGGPIAARAPAHPSLRAPVPAPPPLAAAG